MIGDIFMQIEKVVVGSLNTNCYIITKNNKTIIVDPGDEEKKIINACKGKNVVGILVTHHHFDHITALKKIEDYFHVKESLDISEFNYEIIKTPGHTSDSISYYFPEEKVFFSGDFIFFHTIGRTDLPTGSEEDMQKSLELISKYPNDIKVYPGHGLETTLGKEKENFKYYF